MHCRNIMKVPNVHPSNSTTGVYSNNNSYNYETLEISTFALKSHTYKFPLLSTATPRGWEDLSSSTAKAS